MAKQSRTQKRKVGTVPVKTTHKPDVGEFHGGQRDESQQSGQKAIS
jgi:hypothetical protein